MIKILFVCTGNTCRSPLAEGLFKSYLEKKGIKDIVVGSAGINAYSGDEVSMNSVLAAKKFNVDISSHRAKKLTVYDLDQSDFVFCLSVNHFEYFKQIVAVEKLIYFEEIVDPYGGTLEIYKRTAEQIYDLFDELLIKIFDIRVEKTSIHDISSIIELENKTFSAPWSEISLLNYCKDENCICLTAFCQNKFAGYLLAQNICGDINLMKIAVNEPLRRLGAGKALMQKLFEEDADQISLEVRVSNQAAIGLYNKMGFIIEGRRKNYYESPEEDAYIMIKLLKEIKKDENTGN